MSIRTFFEDLNQPARNPHGIDQGPNWIYWSLSYRRRLIRDVSFLPLALLLTLSIDGVLIFTNRAARVSPVLLLLVFAWIAMSVWNYCKWKNTER